MAADPGPTDRPGFAIGLYLCATLCFVAMDALGKKLTNDGYAPEQIIMLRYALVLLALAPMAIWRWGSRPLATKRPVLHIARGVFVIGAAVCYIYGIRTLPLATATAISFVSPLFVTVLSIVFLKEQVGVRRWSAIAVGFLGVLAIVRPGLGAFDLVMLLPMAASFCWACSLIITRAMKGRETPLAILIWSTAAGLVAITPLGIVSWQPLASDAAWLIALLAMFHIGAQVLVIRAFTFGAASAVAPFGYIALIWATLIGYFAFDTLPDIWTFAGAAILIAAGVYVWHRERAIAHRH